MSIAGLGNVTAISGNVGSSSGSSITGGKVGADFSALVSQFLNADQKHKQGVLSTTPLTGIR